MPPKLGTDFAGEPRVLHRIRDEDCYSIIGTRGSLGNSDPAPAKTFRTRCRSGPRASAASRYAPCPSSAAAIPIKMQIEHFANVIRGDATPLITSRDGLQKTVAVTDVIARVPPGRAARSRFKFTDAQHPLKSRTGSEFMITGKTTVVAHIGYPTETFKAPMIYNPWFAKRGVDAVVVPTGVKAEDYASTLRALFRLTNIRGALITMPHKVTTVSLLDEVSIAVRIARGPATPCSSATTARFARRHFRWPRLRAQPRARSGFLQVRRRSLPRGREWRRRFRDRGLARRRGGGFDIVVRRGRGRNRAPGLALAPALSEDRCAHRLEGSRRP